jgi:hypothetical protein
MITAMTNARALDCEGFRGANLAIQLEMNAKPGG